MLKLFFSAVIMLFSTVLLAQNTKRIEFDLQLRYDKHADYTTRFFGRSFTDDIKLWGKSFGLNFNYFHPIHKRIFLKAGVGYYRLAIDKIRANSRFNIIATGRNIDYNHPLGISLLFSTKKYYYNNVNLAVGLGYNKPLHKKMNFVADTDFTYYYTFSQLYQINYDNIRYKTSNGKTLGISVNTSLGVSYKFNNDKSYISPRLVIPIYQQLSGDKVFGEDSNIKMTKWFNGIGLSIAIGKYL